MSDEGSETFSLMLGRYEKSKASKFDGVLKAWSQDVIRWIDLAKAAKFILLR